MSRASGACSLRAGSLVKLLNMNLSSESTEGGVGRPHHPEPRESFETAEIVVANDLRDKVSDLSDP